MLCIWQASERAYIRAASLTLLKAFSSAILGTYREHGIFQVRHVRAQMLYTTKSCLRYKISTQRIRASPKHTMQTLESVEFEDEVVFARDSAARLFGANSHRKFYC